MNRRTVAKLATSTADAYSFHYYQAKGWASCCALLLDRGFNAVEVDAILRSVLTRFAADSVNTMRRFANGRDLAKFLDSQKSFDGLTLQEYVDATVLAIQTEDDAPITPEPVKLRLVWSR